MKTTVQSLKDLYVKLGGALDDTYIDIEDGMPVDDYAVIPDCIDAIAKLDAASSLVAKSENGTVTINVR